MPALTSEKVEEFLDGKLRLISDLTEQLKQALESISSLNTEYDTILVTLLQLGKDKTAEKMRALKLTYWVLPII